VTLSLPAELELEKVTLSLPAELEYINDLQKKCFVENRSTLQQTPAKVTNPVEEDLANQRIR
tara:strand:- start:1858 stop:2043 length:186 start_codon:yes stop_codon:yes gene_type:complete